MNKVGEFVQTLGAWVLILGVMVLAAVNVNAQALDGRITVDCGVSNGVHCFKVNEGPSVPQIELSGGVAFSPLVHTTVTQGEDKVFDEGARQGVVGEINAPLNDVVGLAGEFSRTTGRFVPTNQFGRVYSESFVGGLRFSERDWSKNIVPFFETLTGVNHRPYLLSHSGNSWLMQLGVGADFYVTHYFGFNIKASYATPFRNRQYDQAVFTGGVSFRFGEK